MPIQPGLLPGGEGEGTALVLVFHPVIIGHRAEVVVGADQTQSERVIAAGGNRQAVTGMLWALAGRPGEGDGIVLYDVSDPGLQRDPGGGGRRRVEVYSVVADDNGLRGLVG